MQNLLVEVRVIGQQLVGDDDLPLFAFFFLLRPFDIETQGSLLGKASLVDEPEK